MVEGETELFSRVAHAVSTIVTSGSIGSDARTDVVAVAADGAKEIAIVISICRAGDDTAERVVHAVAELLVGRWWKRRGFGVPVIRAVGWASSGSVGWRVVGLVDTDGIDLSDLGLEVVEVIQSLHVIAVDRHETVVIRLLEVHVNNATGPNRRHLAAEESPDFCERARRNGVAAIFGEEDGNGICGELLGAHIVARLGEGRVATPRVDVVAPKVNGASGISAVEEVGHVHTDVGVIIGCVSDTNGSVSLRLDVCLGVADCGFDECAGVGVVWRVRHLIAGEEAEDVGVVGHGVNDGGVSLVERIIPSGIIAVDG